MIFHPKEITLKNGKKAILKTPEISDAAGMLAYIRKPAARRIFFSAHPRNGRL